MLVGKGYDCGCVDFVAGRLLCSPRRIVIAYCLRVRALVVVAASCTTPVDCP